MSAAGRISPMAPRSSASPINRILVGLKSCAQPWPALTSLSLGTNSFISPLPAKIDRQDDRDYPQRQIHGVLLSLSC